MPVVRVQIVTFENSFASMRRLLAGVGAAVRHACGVGSASAATLAIGDCSPRPIFTDTEVAALVAAVDDVAACTYEYFDANKGSAGGSNHLARSGVEPLIWILNPDTYPSPTALATLLDAMADDHVAAADARQLPIEHPKGYSLTDGEATWLTGACMLVRRQAFEEVEGFDEHHFPMYCDDVDFSWRLRAAGWSLRTAPRATVFHDKRPGADGQPSGSEFEIESGSLARLKLARRYCRPDVEHRELAALRASGHPALVRAALTFTDLDARGDLPAPMPAAAHVADLDQKYYGQHRFRYDR